MTDDSSLWRLLDRYLAGELAPAERERFERWVALSPERQAWVASLIRITRETGRIRPQTSAATDAAWLRVSRRLGFQRASARGPMRTTDASDVRAPQRESTPRLAWGRSYANAARSRAL